tara:strand:- start:30920 stop:35623 length:4704 start_codon:yes stop_codon:yes gene_type:complete
MALRWLHKTWSIFWTFIGVTIGVLLVVGILSFGLLQLPISKNYIVSKIEDRFNNQHNGVLKLGEFNGTLPISFQFESINLYPDSSSFNPVFSSDTVSATLDFWALFRNRFVVNGLEIASPRLRITSDSTGSILKAIQKRKEVLQSERDTTSVSDTFVEILAPSVVIKNGFIILEDPFPNRTDGLDKLTFEDLNLDMFLDYNATGRFIDIDRLDVTIPELDLEKISLFGQVFNDNRFLEFNAFNLKFGNSILNFSGEADGVDLLKQDFLSQLKSSQLSIEIKELVAEPSTLKRVFKDYPDLDQSIFLSLKGEGDIDSLWFDDFEVIFGQSALNGFGYLSNPFISEKVQYGAELSNILIDSTEFGLINYDFTRAQIEAITTSRLKAEVMGSKRSINGELSIFGERGSIFLNGNLGFTELFPVTVNAIIDSLNLGGIIADRLQYSDLSGTMSIQSSSLKNLSNSIGKAEINFLKGTINEVPFDSIYISGNWDSGFLSPSFSLVAPDAFLSGMGTVDLTDSIPSVEFSGRGSNLDIKGFSKIDKLASAFLDVEYELFLKGSNKNNVYGQVSLDVPFSIVDGDTLPSHQFYADFNEPASDNRSLRITSTAFDLSMNGVFEPNDVMRLTPYWSKYFKNRVDEEFLLKENVQIENVSPVVQDQNFQLDFSIKNLALLKQYFPEAPNLITSANVSSNINMNADRLLFNSTINDSKFLFNESESDSVALQVTGSFRHNEKIKSFGSLKVEAQIGEISSDLVFAKGITVSFELDEDSIQISQTINKIGNDTKLDFKGNASLGDSSLSMTINSFELGSDIYKWQNNRTPTLNFLPKNKLEFKDFTFSNFDEFISIEGMLSNVEDDSVKYVIRSVDLGRISELVNGRIDFSGDLDGIFTTRSLTRTPTIQGELNIFELGLDNNTVGDIRINSTFNQLLNRFDTQISILTDSTKYPNYYIRNDRDGQDIKLNGYVLAPVNGEFPEADSLFSFDLDFENIDLWIIPFIAPKVFTEMSGKATGHGYIWGNLDTYDYNVDYEIGMDDAIYLKPRFLDTYYYGQGLVSFSRSNGLVFKDVFVIDPSGGSAVVSGTYNLNDFQQIHTIDLRIQMDEFQFLNSSFGPDVPFFGKAYGSSTIRMTGTNLNPVLSTNTPIYISDFSNIGIPLLEETEFDEDNKFIRFVDDFNLKNNNSNTVGNGSSIFIPEVDENPFDRTFVERFTLDLQFIATQPMTVQLIFDPVTGDIITANGTGRLQIRLQDEDLSMFGQFDITDGNYQFVSGDIFTRRFELERGGTITWDGSPTDARLNLEAVYQARPDINTLTRARSEIDQESSQRVPVQLVLSIGGSLTSIENNFFFRLPNTFETRQNTTLSAQINTLNRNEDEKLIQATSFLLMGDFIPSTTASTEGTNSLTNNFSGSGAVLNPLLSSQVINPLLSNQINSLLRSDIGSLDIDFNLNTYNNVDLAVALRLYNDRIILSREGQITGAQSNIGDLGATYRINQTLSVTAFHRQDPTFSSFGGVEESQQAQDINGVGLEAEVSFNSWNEFFRKIGTPFRRLFGIKDKKEEPEQEELTENQNPPS